MPDMTFATNLRRYCQGEVLTWQPHPPPDMHITDHLLQPVRRFVHQPCDACPHVHLEPAAQEFAARFWQTAGLPEQGVVAFHPGSGGAYKLWPLTGWEQVMAWAAQQGLPGMIISGPAEQAHNAHLASSVYFPPWPRTQNLPLPHLAALLARCQAVVGHRARASPISLPLLARPPWPSFGPTNPLISGAAQPPRLCTLARAPGAFDARASTAGQRHPDPGICAA